MNMLMKVLSCWFSIVGLAELSARYTYHKSVATLVKDMMAGRADPGMWVADPVPALADGQHSGADHVKKCLACHAAGQDYCIRRSACTASATRTCEGADDHITRDAAFAVAPPGHSMNCSLAGAHHSDHGLDATWQAAAEHAVAHWLGAPHHHDHDHDHLHHHHHHHHHHHDHHRPGQKWHGAMAEVKKCHMGCGSDHECHKQCPRPWAFFEEKCQEFEPILACHKRCHRDHECHVRCPMPACPRMAEAVRGAMECHGSCAEGDWLCHRACPKPLLKLRAKCHMLGEVLACHKNCGHGDCACHHACPKMQQLWHHGGHRAWSTSIHI